VDYEHYRTQNIYVSKTFKQFAKDFGEKIIRLRKQRDLTQEELANKSGVERSYMGAIERGERNPTLKKIYQISKTLKVKIKELLNF